MIFVYFILGAFARRWFGGAFKTGIMSNRGLQTTFMILLFLSIFIKELSYVSIISAIIISLWLQFQFWSRGHGACFDMGRDEKPSEETIKRYNERWYHKPVDYLVKNKYGFLYDFIYMALRYACPMIPLMIIDWKFILIGLFVSPVYSFCWNLKDRENYIFENKPDWINSPTKLAEIIYGGFVYSMMYYIF